jgi:hypothetical protein
MVVRDMKWEEIEKRAKEKKENKENRLKVDNNVKSYLFTLEFCRRLQQSTRQFVNKVCGKRVSRMEKPCYARTSIDFGTLFPVVQKEKAMNRHNTSIEV